MKPMIIVDDPYTVKTQDVERGWVVLRQPIGSGNRAARRAAAATARKRTRKQSDPTAYQNEGN